MKQDILDIKSKQRTSAQDNITVSVPGRICLFGEHQDYLKLPVITAAINLRVRITGKSVDSKDITLHLPDLKEEKHLRLPPYGRLMAYEEERDYYRSVINVLKKHGVEIMKGCECTVRGNIPINSGTSSSSALNVAWCRFLLAVHSSAPPEILNNPERIARLAYLAEVEEFGEPGGMMDHYATALGGVLYLQFNDQVTIERLTANLGTFVLGDSQEPKDTKGILKRVKQGILDAVSMIRAHDPDFDLAKVPAGGAERYLSLLNLNQAEVLEGALRIRDLTRQALQILRAESIDDATVGRLLAKHQDLLRDYLRISTPKIDRMLTAAMKAGAAGGKINGSGGGGCMFAYAPSDPEKIARAIELEGGKAYIVKVDQGLCID